MTELGLNGCRLVANLHADTLAEARAQIVAECGAGEKGFNAFTIFIPISLVGRGFTVTRQVQHLDWFNGRDWEAIPRETALNAEEEAICRFIEQCLDLGIYSCLEVRTAWRRWLQTAG
jgi:hypothetical protein